MLLIAEYTDNCYILCFDIKQQLYEAHSQFSKDMQLVINKDSGHTIADIFILNKEKFLIYGEYCSNLLSAQDLLDYLCNTKPAVQSRVTVCVAFVSVISSVKTFTISVLYSADFVESSVRWSLKLSWVTSFRFYAAAVYR